jgi:hypothetical protein
MDFWEIELPERVQFYIDIKVSRGAETWGVTNLDGFKLRRKILWFPLR